MGSPSHLSCQELRDRVDTVMQYLFVTLIRDYQEYVFPAKGCGNAAELLMSHEKFVLLVRDTIVKKATREEDKMKAAAAVAAFTGQQAAVPMQVG